MMEWNEQIAVINWLKEIRDIIKVDGFYDDMESLKKVLDSMLREGE